MLFGALSSHNRTCHHAHVLVSALSVHRSGQRYYKACFSTAAVTIQGEVQDYRSVADSGNVMRRRFFPKCGIHLFSEAEARPHLIFVRVGTLDYPEIARATMTIWISAARTWCRGLCIAYPRLPAVTNILYELRSHRNATSRVYSCKQHDLGRS